MKIILRSLILIFISGNAFAQTSLPSVLNCNTTLTTANSPYLFQRHTVLSAGCELIVQPGVEMIMPDSANLIIRGYASFMGDSTNPIHIHPQNAMWCNIYFENTMAANKMNYVMIEGGTHTVGYNNTSIAADTNLQRATVSCYYSALEISNCTFKNNKRCIYTKYGSVHINKCVFDSTNREEKINIAFTRNALVENSWFSRTYGCEIHDMLDFDGVHNGIIRNNIFLNGDDDAVDLGEWESKNTDTVLVSGNWIEGFWCGKGVSVGERTRHATIERNVIVNCDRGVAVKDTSDAVIVNNTFYKDSTGIAVYQKVAGWGGGYAVIRNNIIANSLKKALKVDSVSTAITSYNLSDTDSIYTYYGNISYQGTGNLKANPMFVSETSKDFHLMSGSPCINTGDPSSSPDPDNSRADMGAYYFNLSSGIKNYHTFPAEIFPNPTTGIINVRFISENKSLNISVMNVCGQLVSSKKCNSSSGIYQEEIDLNHLTKGVYFIKMEGLNRKIIIQ